VRYFRYNAALRRSSRLMRYGYLTSFDRVIGIGVALRRNVPLDTLIKNIIKFVNYAEIRHITIKKWKKST
jgi:hypothetical protein